MMAAGEIQKDGRFTLTTHYVLAGKAHTKPGAVAGEYTVTVESPEPKGDRRGAKETAPVVIPRKYRVEAGPNSFVIETPPPVRH
jgi:hypothetical protein